MKNILLTMILLFAVFPLFSQKSVPSKSSKIESRLLDSGGSPVMYASVALLLIDSTIVNSAITTVDGHFKIEGVEAGTYKIRIDHIEYETYMTASFPVTANETKVLPAISLKPAINELGEVVVTYRKPLIEIAADKLIFNVSSSPSVSGTNGLDLLRKSPGVTVDMDDNISLLGKSGVQIYINGVPSRLSGADLTTFLQSMTSDNIEAIEIISNPSAKYEAEGNAGIINIRMKKNNSLGFNGSETSSFTKGIHLRYNNSLSLNYGGEKVKTNFQITQSGEKRLDDFLDTKMQNDGIFDLDSKEIKIRNGLNIDFGLETQLAKNHLLNFSARTVLNQNDNTLKGYTHIYNAEPKELSGILYSQSIVDLPSKNYTFNLNHNWQTSEHSSISSAISLGSFKNDQNTQQPNTLLEADGLTIRTVENSEFDGKTNIGLWSAKTDFEKEWNKVVFSAGLKYAQIATENSFDFYNIFSEQAVFDPTKSNDFNYTENVAAVYGIINYKLSKSVKLNAGIRIENTDSRGQLISDLPIDNKDVPRNYTDIFPNVGLSFSNQKDHSLNINIGRRVNRPNYQDLNPFETPISQLTVWKGNPFLKPNYIMNYQFSYAYKSKLIITNTYSVTKDFFATILEITGDNSNQLIPRNLDRATNYGISISYPVEVAKYWSFVPFVNGAYKTYQGNIKGALIDLTAKTWDISIQNNIKLPWNITLDLSYFIESDWIWRGSIRVKGNQNLSFGLSKKFLADRLQVRITGSDIFRTTKDYFYHGNYGGIDIDGVRSFDSQRFGAGVTFKFGNQKAKTKRKTNSALDDELNRIVD